MLVDTHGCLGVGECGLDYSEGFPSKEFQIPWFKAQVQMAIDKSLPLYLHVRDAQDDFLNVMKESGFSSSSPPPVGKSYNMSNSCLKRILQEFISSIINQRLLRTLLYRYNR